MATTAQGQKVARAAEKARRVTWTGPLRTAGQHNGRRSGGRDRRARRRGRLGGLFGQENVRDRLEPQKITFPPAEAMTPEETAEVGDFAGAYVDAGT